MEALVNKKNRIMEGLLTSTIRMLDAGRAQEFENMSQRLYERALLFKELEFCNEQLKNHSTKFDSIWQAQFMHIVRMDEEIELQIAGLHFNSNKELAHLQNLKSELIRAHAIEPKGQRIEAEG